MNLQVPSRTQPPAQGDGPTRRPYAGESYYGRPPLKPSPWDWTVSGYIYLAGLAGAAQGIAAIAQRIDRRAYAGAVRGARFLGTLGSAVGSILLIVDLRTPQRWYNMLRILRPTSPMSFGTYVLGAFGIFSSVTALDELTRGRGRMGRAAEAAADAAQVGAAVTGAGATTYTASLLASTSTPYWAAAPRHLGVLFAASSVATAAAALSLGERLGGRHATARRLDGLAALASAALVATSLAADRRRRAKGIPADLDASNPGRIKQAGLALAGAVPLGAYALSRMNGGRSPGLSVLGSLSLLAGGYLLRHATLKLGMESAERPEAWFRFAQPENLPGRNRQALEDGRRRRERLP